MQWIIQEMECYPEVQGEVDVVFRVHWVLVASDGPYKGRLCGVSALQLNSSEPFTPYSQLTETQVVGWVKSALGPEQVLINESMVLQQIQDQKNPPIVTPPLPWN